MVCTTPLSSAGHVFVEVSTNGRDYASEGVHYEMVAVALERAPVGGPELGGTVVTIEGGRVGAIND